MHCFTKHYHLINRIEKVYFDHYGYSVCLLFANICFDENLTDIKVHIVEQARDFVSFCKSAETHP